MYPAAMELAQQRRRELVQAAAQTPVGAAGEGAPHAGPHPRECGGTDFHEPGRDESTPHRAWRAGGRTRRDRGTSSDRAGRARP